MNKLLILSVFLFSTSLQAWNCKYEKEIDQELDLEGAEVLVVLARVPDQRAVVDAVRHAVEILIRDCCIGGADGARRVGAVALPGRGPDSRHAARVRA